MATEHQTNAASAAKEAEESLPAFNQTDTIDFFAEEMKGLVPGNVAVPTETYKKIGAVIVKTIHTYIAPLIYAANKHRHPVDVLGTGTELIESEPSDLQFPLE